MAAQRIEGFPVPANCVELVRETAKELRALAAYGVGNSGSMFSGMLRVTFEPTPVMGSEVQGLFTVADDSRKRPACTPVTFLEAIRVTCAAFGVDLPSTGW